MFCISSFCLMSKWHFFSCPQLHLHMEHCCCIFNYTHKNCPCLRASIHAVHSALLLICTVGALFLYRSLLEMVCLPRYVNSVLKWSILATTLNCSVRSQIWHWGIMLAVILSVNMKLKGVSGFRYKQQLCFYV